MKRVAEIRCIYRLPSQPFIEWVRIRISVFYKSQDIFAEEMQEKVSWVNRLLQEQIKTIDIDKADEILCKDGSAHLRELYPEIYEE